MVDVKNSVSKEEWETIGKPDGEKIGLKTYFLQIQFGEERIFNENFIQEFNVVQQAEEFGKGKIIEIKAKEDTFNFFLEGTGVSCWPGISRE